MNGTKVKTLLIVGSAIFLVGMGLTIGWQIAAWLGGSRLSACEFPFGSELRVTVDATGRIYVGDNFYSRIQRYAPTGQFERGWFVDTDGIFVLRTTVDDRIDVATARRGGVLTYTTDGRLLSHVDDDYAYRRYSALPETAGHYTIKGWLLPRVVDTRTGQTVVATPWAKRLIAAPFPSFAYSILGVVLIAASEWQRRRERGRLRTSSPQ